MTPYAEFTALEQEQQANMDAFYLHSWGCEPNRAGACIEYDLDLEGFGTVEEKYRFASYPDILVEIVQDLRPFNRGWFYTSKADYLFYIQVVNGCPANLWWARMAEFKAWCLDYWAKNSRQFAVLSHRGRGVSVNLAIPRRLIPAGMAEETDLAWYFNTVEAIDAARTEDVAGGV